MTPNLRIALSASLCTYLLAGCLPSLHPLYSEDAAVFREELLGTWSIQYTHGPGNSIDLKFESLDDEMYRLTVTAFGSELLYDAALVELGGHIFLDYRRTFERKNDELNFLYQDLLPVHMLVRIRFEDDCLVTEFLGETWLHNYLRRHPEELDHTIMGDRLLLTADTEELQQFFVAHAEDWEIAEERTWPRIDP